MSSEKKGDRAWEFRNLGLSEGLLVFEEIEIYISSYWSASSREF